jgi:hypothetical protein
VVDHDILPHAFRLGLDEFRSALQHNTVQRTLQAYKPKLALIFASYAKSEVVAAAGQPRGNVAHGNPRAKPVLMLARRAFHDMMDDAGCLRASLSDAALQAIITKCARSPKARAQPTLVQLNYIEWVDALAACAVTLNPNPYMPMTTKLDEFLDNFGTSGEKSKQQQ